MAVDFDVEVRNARADSVETAIGPSPILQLRSGTKPTDTASADSGDILMEIPLPSNWLNDAANGAVTKAGTWQGNADAGGTIGHFRIKEAGSPDLTKIQGTCGLTGSGADMEFDNTNVAVGQQVTITGFGWTEPND